MAQRGILIEPNARRQRDFPRAKSSRNSLELLVLIGANKLLLIEYGSPEGRSVPARSLFNVRVVSQVTYMATWL